MFILVQKPLRRTYTPLLSIEILQTELTDLVQIKPHEIDRDSGEIVEDKINEKYSDKVIQKIGLCMYMYDLLDASEGLIGYGDGTVNVNVRFRLLVFRPFHSEVLLGRVIALSPTGIRISVDFFEAITVSPDLLFENMKFVPDDETEAGGGWLWDNDGNELWIDLGDTVRLRVEREEWRDQTPKGPVISREDGTMAVGEVNGLREGEDVEHEREPYRIVASMNAGGMGPLTWW
ncbi:MAG: hypothetical protein Q9227_005412 [Pyrenula ochraceoflavens]